MDARLEAWTEWSRRVTRLHDAEYCLTEALQRESDGEEDAIELPADAAEMIREALVQIGAALLIVEEIRPAKAA